ncbi:MAG: glycosyltransferase family 2 protein [Planctomycetota bacterium]
MPPELSVLIPSKNGSETLPLLLSALKSQLAPDDELVVVDDGSTDGTGRIAAAMGARVVAHESSRGVAATRNRLAKESSRGVLVFLDDDVIPYPSYLDEVRRIFSDETVQVCQGIHSSAPADARPDSWQICEAASWHFYMTEQIVESGSCYSLTSQAFCIRRELFETLGGFDESYKEAGGEEFALTLRILESSAIRYTPELVTFHHFQSLFPRMKTLFRRSRHYASIYSRMPPLIRRIHRVEFLHCLLFSLTVLSVLAKAFVGVAGGWLWACAGLWLASDWRYWRHVLSLRPGHALHLFFQRAGQYAAICTGAGVRMVSR